MERQIKKERMKDGRTEKKEVAMLCERQLRGVKLQGACVQQLYGGKLHNEEETRRKEKRKKESRKKRKKEGRTHGRTKKAEQSKAKRTGVKLRFGDGARSKAARRRVAHRGACKTLYHAIPFHLAQGHKKALCRLEPAMARVALQ